MASSQQVAKQPLRGQVAVVCGGSKGIGKATAEEFLRLGGSEIEDRGDHLVVRSPHNPTFWWGNFLLLERAPTNADVPRWIDRFQSTFPDALHRAFGIADAAATLDDVSDAFKICAEEIEVSENENSPCGCGDIPF